MSTTEAIEKLKEYMRGHGLTQVQLAEKLGWKPSDLNTTLKGKKPLGRKRLEHLAKTLGIAFNITLEIGEVRVTERTQKEKEREEYPIPLVEGYIAGGSGMLPLDTIKDVVWIPKKYLKSPAGHVDRYVAVEVRGNSMEPILEDGEIVVIDRTDRDLEHLGERSAYAVRKDHENAVVKHLKLIPKDNMLELISANAQWIRKHGFEYIKLNEVEENPIIGKVVFSFRRWK